VRLAAAVLRAARVHDASPVAVARRAADLRRRGFTVREAEAFGLLDPAMPRSELDLFVSRREAYALQDALNPEGFRALAEDKALFARFCEWRALPAPRVLGLYRRDGAGWTPGAATPSGPAAWRDWIVGALPDEFVLKPAWGHLGKGVRVIVREGDGFRDVGGGRLDAAGVLRVMDEHPDWPAWIVQERIRNHPDLRRLSGTETVQTVRVLSLLGRGGAARVLRADLRVVMGDAVVDNWRDGTTGNAVAPVDRATGRLGDAIGPSPDGRGLVVHPRHPRTGERFADVVLPGWGRAVALVERAAVEIAPMRALGWDVVLGPDGPLLLESQARWGPQNHTRAMREVMLALRGELRDGDP
jgi:hypothetical protein